MTTATRQNKAPQGNLIDRAAEAPPPDQEPDLLDRAILQTAVRLDRLGERCREAVEAADGQMQRAMFLAAGMDQLRKAITPPVLGLVRTLMNTDLGFDTDRNPKKPRKDGRVDPPYGDEEVRDCLVAAAIHGLFWTGNEFNIISGKCYITLNGYARKLREVPGISDINVAPGSPVLHNGRQVVRVALSWAINGKKDQLIGSDGKPGLAFPLIAYGRESADQLIGKAKRKALKAAYEKATGSAHLLPDGDVGDPADAPAFTNGDKLLDTLKTNAAAAEQVKRIQDLSRGWEPDEFRVLAERCGDADPLKMTPEQRDALILQLEATAREAADPDGAAERQAIAGE